MIHESYADGWLGSSRPQPVPRRVAHRTGVETTPTPSRSGTRAAERGQDGHRPTRWREDQGGGRRTSATIWAMRGVSRSWRRCSREVEGGDGAETGTGTGGAVEGKRGGGGGG